MAQHIYTPAAQVIWTQQGAKLIGSGAVGVALLGASVSISADGNTAVVGAPGDNDFQGAIWVFTRSAGIWTQQGTKLLGTGLGTVYPKFGFSVSLSADGSTFVAGAYGDDAAQGSAFIFTNSGGTWSQQGSKLVSTNALSGQQQGYSVSISANGNTVIVGASGDNINVGAAYIYTRSASIWTQQGAKLVGTDAAGGAQQGSAVSLSADGNTAIVGGVDDNALVGAAWVYTRNGGTWTQQGTKLTGSAAIGTAEEGSSVAMSADGTTAFVGGQADNSWIGAAWVYTVPDPTITSFSPSSGPVGTLVTVTGTNLNSPTTFKIGGVPAIIVSNTGTQLVGMVMPGATISQVSITTANGSVNSTSNFTVTATPYPTIQQGNKLLVSGGVTGQGYSMSVSADGNTAIIGGPLSDNTGIGAAWIFTRAGGTWTQQGAKLLGTGTTVPANQGAAVAISADGNTVIIGGPQDNTSPGDGLGAVWVFTRTAGVWAQQGPKLVGTGASGKALQGSSVSISADGNTAIVGAPDDNNNTGAVWLFTRSGTTWTQQGTKLVGTGAAGVTGQAAFNPSQGHICIP